MMIEIEDAYDTGKGIYVRFAMYVTKCMLDRIF